MQDAIGEMAAFGIPQSRIAALVGKSGGYVSVAVERSKKKVAAKPSKDRHGTAE